MTTINCKSKIFFLSKITTEDFVNYVHIYLKKKLIVDYIIQTLLAYHTIALTSGIWHEPL